MSRKKKKDLLVTSASVLEKITGNVLSEKKVTLKESGAVAFTYHLSDLDTAQFEQVRHLINDYANQDKTFSFAFVESSFKPDAVFFDMDATVIKQESIVELSRIAGTESLVEDITERAMAGEIDFEAALRERVLTLKGLDDDVFERVFPILTLQPYIKELVHFFNIRNIPTFLVSGGFIQLAQP